MLKKLTLIIALFSLLGASTALADPIPANAWLKQSDQANPCITSADNCSFSVTGSTASTALFQIDGQGASITMNPLGVTNGVSYNVIRNVSLLQNPNAGVTQPTLVNDGQIFTGCAAQTTDYCIIPPGSYWLEFTSEATGLLLLNGIP